jgi:hypothetical protein
LINFYLLSSKDIQDDKKRAAFRDKIRSYFERAESLKKLVEEIKQCKRRKNKLFLIYNFLIQAGKYHEQIQIEDNSTGNSYEKLFSRFFADDTVEHIHIVDPYIRARHQVSFCFSFIYRFNKTQSLSLDSSIFEVL